jgi:hypothetical protein
MTYNVLVIVHEWFYTNSFYRQLVNTNAAVNLSTASTNLPVTILSEFLRECYIIFVNKSAKKNVAMNAIILTAKVIKFLSTSVTNNQTNKQTIKETNNMQQPFKRS